MPTNEELKALVNTNIRTKTTAESITKGNTANAIDAAYDYTDQQNVVKIKKVSLTSAQILSLFTTPKELIPAQSGKLFIVRHIFQKYTHVTTPYTTTTWRIGYNGITFGFVNLTAIITSADNAESLYPVSPSVSASGTSYVNLPLVLGATTSDPTGGDGTLDLYITYYEITL